MRTLAFGLVPALLLVAACGGGGGGEDDQPDITFVASPVATLDGSVDENGVVNTDGGTLGAGGIVVGDAVTNVEVRGFFVFDISALPAEARVQAATLEIRQIGSTGGPYFDLGQVVMDHVVVGSTLNGADFDAAALDAGFAVVSTSPVPGTIILDVTSQVGADGIALRTETAFRIRFTMATDNNGDHDLANFQDGDDSDGTGILPRLTITYEE